MFVQSVSRRIPRLIKNRSISHEAHHGEQFNEPTGYLFGRRPGQGFNIDWSDKIFITFYFGGLAAFVFLYQYKPDTDPYKWARREAERRMKERGVDIDEYRYKLPKVY